MPKLKKSLKDQFSAVFLIKYKLPILDFIMYMDVSTLLLTARTADFVVYNMDESTLLLTVRTPDFGCLYGRVHSQGRYSLR